MQKVRCHTIACAPTACRRTVSGSISLPSPGFFSPFPHGTCSLSVIGEYLGLADGPAGFTPDVCVLCYSGSCSQCLGFRVQVFNLLWPCLPALSPSRNHSLYTVPQPLQKSLPAVWPLPGSLAATTGITYLFSFPEGTKMFQFPSFAPTHLLIQSVVTLRWGSPIRTSPGQSLLGGSPMLFAA